MRFLLAVLLLLAVCLALPIPPEDSVSLLLSARADDNHHIGLLSYSHDQAYTEFAIPCPECQIDQELLFRFQAHSSPATSPDLTFSINDIRFVYPVDDTLPSFSHTIPAFDTAGNVRSVTLSWSLCPGESHSTSNIQLFHFTLVAVDAISDPNIAFSVGMDTKEKAPRLSELFSTSSSELIRFSESEDTYNRVEMSTAESAEGSTAFNITGELEYLRHLEAQATELRAQIVNAKASITQRLRQNRNNVCLKHLIKECDGVVCAARVIAQRICDKMGINIDPAFGFVPWDTNSNQNPINLNSSNEKSSFLSNVNDNTYTTHGLQGPLFLPDSGPRNPILYVLSAFAGLLGLTSLWLLIKKRCASARTRAERAADREERRNKRTYRRAARRALMRKRWHDFLASLSCFRSSPSTNDNARREDYEEKRALILQDAFLEQDLDLVEKGQVMEAEIRELRHAHEIVASLVRVDNDGNDHVNRYAVIPPPPAFPYTPTTARSRAASSYTLPSYTSESLPDYTSRYSRERRLSGSTADFAPSLPSDHEGSTQFTPSTSSESGAGRRTPDGSSRSENSGSSVVDVSTRPSGETLRTGRPSVDTIGR